MSRFPQLLHAALLLSVPSACVSSTAIQQPTDHPEIAALAATWAEQFSHEDGDQTHIRGQVDAALACGDTASAVNGVLSLLASDPDRPDDLLRLVVASHARHPHALSARQRQVVLDVVSKHAPNAPMLALGQAWEVLEADPQQTMDMLEAAVATPFDDVLRLAALQATGQPSTVVAEGLLEDCPGQPMACESLTAFWLQEQAPAEALLVAEACLAAGPQPTTTPRMHARALDAVGLFAEAADAYQELGMNTHAAAIRMQEGWADDAQVDALLDPQTPDGVLHRLWWALITDRPAAVEAGLSSLREQPVTGEAFDLALAAGELYVGNPAAALSVLDGSDAQAANVLRARALWRLEQQGEALQILAAARLDMPWNLRVALLELSYLSAVNPEQATALQRQFSARHPAEIAAVSWYRNREIPWTVIVPDAALTTGDTALLQPKLDVLLDTPAGNENSPLIEDLRSVQQGLAGLADGAECAACVAVGKRHPHAVGLQRLIISQRRP